MTTLERTSIENGIWLCADCSIKIDRDVERYPADLLRRWKGQAEDHSVRELGKQLPSEGHALNQVSMALAGLPGFFVPKAIQNVHMASALALEKIDSRFRIETSYRNRRTTFTLHAQETIPMSFQVDTEANAGFLEKFFALLDHGESLRVSTKGVTFHGSPLFEQALSPTLFPNGEFVISPHARPALVKIGVVDEATLHVSSLSEVGGGIVFGTKSLTFKGACYSDILALTVNAPLAQTASITVAFSFITNLERWIGQDVRTLPYFDQISYLYECMALGRSVDLQLEMEGRRVLAGRVKLGAENSIQGAELAVFEYTRIARDFATRMNVAIAFQLSLSVTAEDHQRLVECVEILSGTDTQGQEALRGITVDLSEFTNDGSLQALRQQNEPCEIVFVQKSVEPLMVFGQPIPLPDIKTTLVGLLPKFLDGSSAVDKDDTVQVQLIPTSGFRISRSFLI